METTATETFVRIGNDITITCSVRRGNPSNYVYTITNADTSSTTTGPTRTLTSIQMSDLGTYRCDVTNDAGTGSSSVIIELGGRCIAKHTLGINVNLQSSVKQCVLYKCLF